MLYDLIMEWWTTGIAREHLNYEFLLRTGYPANYNYAEARRYLASGMEPWEWFAAGEP